MQKRFTVTGLCVPEMHYMVDLSGRVKQIVSEYIEPGMYFTINRARQFGKTTTLFMLEEGMKEDYLVLSRPAVFLSLFIARYDKIVYTKPVLT